MFRSFGMGLVAVGMMALVGCAGESGADGHEGATGEEGESALTRVAAEPSGANCANGGQAFLVGIDKNDNHELDDSEVTSKAFVCNGSSQSVDMQQIAPGDSRCPNGGVAFDMHEGPDLVACNGVDGARGAQGLQGEKGDQGLRGLQGYQGEQGLTGAKGDDGADGINGVDGADGADGAQGPQGAPAPEQKLGVFLPSQVVKGMVLTCTTMNQTATTVECRGMKVNGLDVYLGPREAGLLCSGVTNGGYNSANGMGVVPAPWMSLDKNGVWNVAAAGNASPLQNLVCNR